MGAVSRTHRPRSQGMYGKALELGVVGGLAFWATNFAISLTPTAAEYRAALSISYPLMTLEALLGGVVIGCFVGFVLLRFFDWIPTRRSVLKSLILSLLALIVMEAFSVLLYLGHPSYPGVYVLVGAAINVPRFLALGLAIGYLYDRLTERVPSASRARARPGGY